MIKQIT